MTIRTHVLTALLFALILVPSVSYADEALDTYNQIKQYFPYANSSTALTGQPAGTDSVQFVKCGTPIMRLAQGLPEEYRKALGIMTYAHRPYWSDLPLVFRSASGRFVIHYNNTPGNQDQINQTFGDANANGVPDYAEIVARIADSVWVHHIDSLGFHEPLNDSAYVWGDGPGYDIYVGHLGAGYYGATMSDTVIVDGTHYRATSWMQLQNHYETFQGYAHRPIEALQVTIAHEFLHALQFWYDGIEDCTDPICAGRNGYWMEMSAVWAEDETYNNVNDYYYYLPSYFPHIDRSLRFWQTTGVWEPNYPYGAGVFPMYLSQRFGRDIVRKAWEHCGDVNGGNFLESALSSALAEMTGGQIDMPHAWTEYSRWLFFTGARTRPGQFYREASNYPAIPDSALNNVNANVPYIRTFSQYPISMPDTRGFQFYPDDFAFNYLDFKTSTLDSVLTFTFDGSKVGDASDWRITAIAYSSTDPSSAIWIDDVLHTNKETFEEKDFHAYTDILIVPTLVNPALHWSRNAYQFAVADTSIPITNDQITYGPSKIFPNGSDPDQASLKVYVKTINGGNVTMNVFTTAGEKVFSTSKTVPQATLDQLQWDANSDYDQQVASGVYVVQVRFGGSEQHFKVLVVR